VILDPPVIALLLGSVMISYLVLYSSAFGIQILRKWDIKSGSELQLNLERKTYLISTIISYAFGFQLLSLFLFIYTADDLCRLFVGAMCAVGTLNVNEYGYPALILKVVNFLFAGAWLILNYADNRAFDYPLIRKKYILLLIISPFILVETVLLFMYFLGLHPNVITSCCGSLFSSEGAGLSSSLASFPSIPMKIAFYSTMGLLQASGIFFYRRPNLSGYIFSFMSAASFVVSIAALISFISLYFYELPTHHCPFCILQRGYWYIGYVIYILLLTGAVTGTGTLMPFRKIGSLENVIPAMMRKLTLVSLISYLIFAAISTYQMIFSNFKLEGY
jgi:hypothetical protein